jgi:hypothetical protein
MATGKFDVDPSRRRLIANICNSFFYADERNVDGSLKGMQIDGEAHAEFFAQLANGEGEVPWHATFVKGQGYVKF